MAACHIRKNLAALRQFPRVALNNIRDLPEAFKPVGTFLSPQVKRAKKIIQFRGLKCYLYSPLIHKYKLQCYCIREQTLLQICMVLELVLCGKEWEHFSLKTAIP